MKSLCLCQKGEADTYCYGNRQQCGIGFGFIIEKGSRNGCLQLVKKVDFNYIFAV
jgi:hypothetical protein